MSDPEQQSFPSLGQQDELLELNDRDEVAAMTLAMASQSRRYVDIVSRHLDPMLYDTDEFAGALKQLALSSRRAQVRMLIIDARPLITAGHRLIDLTNRLPSFLSIRAPARQHSGFNEAFMVADRVGYIHRQFSDRFEAQINFSDRGGASSLSERFNNMWERGVPETRFRRLHI